MSKFDACLVSLNLRDAVPVDALRATAAEYQQQGMEPSAAMQRAVEEQLQLAQMEEAKVVRAVREQWEAQGGAKPASAQPAEAAATGVPAVTTGASPATTGAKKEPWQMSGAEWTKARDAVRPNVAQSKFTKASGSEAVGNDKRLRELIYGVPDAARERLNAAARKEIKLSRDEVDDLLERVNSPVSHRDVVDKAIAEGKPVPAEVMAEYPDLVAEQSAEPQPAPADTAPAPIQAEQEPQEQEEGDDLRASMDSTRTIEVDGVRRPITNSRGQLVAQDFAGQKAFWEFYGNGPVDEKGQPVVMFHGTASDVREFNAGLTWLAADPDLANAFVGGGRRSMGQKAKAGSNVMPVYAAVQKPLDLTEVPDGWLSYAEFLTAIGHPELMAELEGQINPYRGITHANYKLDDKVQLYSVIEEKPILNMLRALGYDGYLWNEQYDYKVPQGRGQKALNKFGDSITYAAFGPEQVKSAIGNSGKYDASNPDIRAAEDAQPGEMDIQLAQAIRDGITVDKLLALIESESANADNRALATALRAQQLQTKIEFGTAQGNYASGNAEQANASYRPATDTAYLHREMGAEQSALHELVHAATLRALGRGGRAAQQIKALHKYVKDLPSFKGYYGITDPEEFIAEALTSQSFRQQLMDTPASGVKLSVWQKIVGIVRMVLGLPATQENVLAQVMALSPDLMAENQARGEVPEQGMRASMSSQLAGAISNGLSAASLQELPGKVANRLSDFRNVGLQFLGRRQLVDLYAGQFQAEGKESTLARYSNLMQQMDADKNEAGAEADGIADRWGKLADADKLADLMHDSTLAQIDPTKDHIAGDNKAEHSALQRRLKALSPEGQALYAEARDAYHKHWMKVRAEIRNRIERAMPDNARRAKLLEKMDATFYEKVKGVYFPLARFGDYVVTVSDKDGARLSVNFAETTNEAEALRRELLKKFPAADGHVVSKITKKKEFNPGRDAVSRGFMQELFGVLDQYEGSAELQDDINQLYLQSMPDLSWTKHGIHRKGTPGFSQDARRAFAQNLFHGARYLAKLRYGDRLADFLDEMQDHVDAKATDEAYDSVRAQQVVDEMNKRHDAYMNPQGNQLSNTLTSLGFIFYLGLSPASAVVNLTQTPLVTLPMLAAKHGFGKASAALLAAAKLTAGAKNDVSKVLQGDELRAYQQAVDAGVIDVSMAHDLAGIASGDDTKAHGKLRPVMKWASFMFHHGEKFNRQASLLAAYRLARDAGQGHDAAYKAAVEDVYASHFDYSSGNRARVMQGPVARVVLLFKQYAQNMVYVLVRNAVLAAKGDKVALRTLSGLLISHAMAAGVLGLPAVGTLLSAATMIGGDDDEPWDAKVALRNYIADLIGQKPAEVLMHGFSRLTPFDISGRVGLDKLILPDIQEGLEGARAAESWMTAALGPVAGIGLSASKGLANIAEGNVLRGLEDMMPVSVRNPLKALRLNSEGVKDKTGIPILDDTSAMEELGQLIGFSPSRSREAMEGKSAVYRAEHKLLDRRAALVEQWAHARQADDAEGAAEVWEQVQRFNEKNPGRRITMPNLVQSLRSRNKRIREAEDGVYLPKKHADVRDLGRFATAGD